MLNVVNLMKVKLFYGPLSMVNRPASEPVRCVGASKVAPLERICLNSVSGSRNARKLVGSQIIRAGAMDAQGPFVIGINFN
jgi:hypothetical protein